jgi:hypothetical protein
LYIIALSCPTHFAIEPQAVDGNGIQLTEEEIAEVLTEAFASDRSQAIDSSSESDGTERGQDQDRRQSSKPATPAGRLEEPHPSAAGSVADDLTNASINSSPGSSSFSVHGAQSQTAASSEGPWQIHYSKIPGSSEGTCGPVLPNMLVERLGLRKELVCRFSFR